jgi:hypothetical protein
VFAARYELNSYIVFRKRLVSRRLSTTMKAYRGGEGTFSRLASGELPASRSGRFTPDKKGPGIGGWVGPRAGLNDVETILDPTGTRTPIHMSSSPTPYRL